MMIQTNDAARIMGVTTRTIQNYVNRGLLPAKLKQHGFRSFHEYDLDEVIDFAESNGLRVDANLVFNIMARGA